MPSQTMVRLIRSGTAVRAFAVAVVVASFAGGPAVASAEETNGPNKSLTTWLCNPQKQSAVEDPCLESRAATVVSYSGNTRKETIEPEAPSNGTPVDCFYVYPTVNKLEGPNAKAEKPGPEEELVAREQASRFSQVCKVYAPLYPQVTLLAKPATPSEAAQEAEVAYQGAKTAFEAYMANYNGGRGFVLIGHSQGAAVLKAIIHRLIEGEHKAWLHQLVSAVVLGGAVEVKAGEQANGSFNEVPACSTEAQAGCVIAYSSYYTESPPEVAPSSVFTRTIWPGREVLCVNPTLATQNKTSSGPLYPYVPTTTMRGEVEGGQPAPKATTPWVSEPGLATAQCRRYDWATWLQVKLASMSAPVEAERKADDELPEEEKGEGENWGLHRYDVNEALGNLVGTVEAEEKTYLAGG